MGGVSYGEVGSSAPPQEPPPFLREVRVPELPSVPPLAPAGPTASAGGDRSWSTELRICRLRPAGEGDTGHPLEAAARCLRCRASSLGKWNPPGHMDARCGFNTCTHRKPSHSLAVLLTDPRGEGRCAESRGKAGPPSQVTREPERGQGSKPRYKVVRAAVTNFSRG